MGTSSRLTTSLGKQVGDALQRAFDEGTTSVPSPDELADALPPLVSSEGTTLGRFRDVAHRAASLKAGRLDIVGMRGAAGPALSAFVARRVPRPLVYVVADLERARKVAEDLAFLIQGAEPGAEEQAEDTGQGDVLLLSAPEASPYADVQPDRRAAMARMATLSHLAAADRPWRVLVLTASALIRKVVPRDVVRASTARIVAEDELHRDDLIAGLVDGGYLRVPVVEDPGTFAVRGALLDVWPPSADLPVRVELYGDLVVSMKPFDPLGQRTNVRGEDSTGLKELWLPPVRETILARNFVEDARAHLQELADACNYPTLKARTLMDDVVSGRVFFGADGYLPAFYGALDPVERYLPPETLFVLDDPPGILQALREEWQRAEADRGQKGAVPHFAENAFYTQESESDGLLARHGVVVLHRTRVLGNEGPSLSRYETVEDAVDVGALDHEDLTRAVKTERSSKGKAATLRPLVRRLAHFRDHGLRVFLVARAQIQAERLTALLRHQGIECRAALKRFDFDKALSEDGTRDSIDVVVGGLSRGVVLPAEGLVLITEEEIFGTRAHRRKERKSQGETPRSFLNDLRSLAVGDFIVHVEHGVGRYQGLVHKEVGGLKVDLIAVEYASGDRLYLPVYRLNQIQKFMGGEHGEPKLDRLGGSTFAKTKAKVRREVRQMADELLRLYAERQAQTGFPFPPLDDEYRTFEATFPFDETPDQGRAIADVHHDLEKAQPMDRLVCGDVGFGKTEVAIRAAFRVAAAGKQVCVLCPTTVLAQQHLRTFEKRMGDYPFVLRGLSRFQSKKESDETLRGLKEGKVDIVIGTHRLLSKDVHFKDLGLLVVDEEQRFGVAHKERIKQMRVQVDVLTLTATPIPRTLQMAVSGLRDLSLITTAPVDRRAVRTVVCRYDAQVLREAVRRELSRGGQIFYVYNRIEGLYERAQKLQELVPEARIAVAHGQMARAGKESEMGALEQSMLDFVEGRYDVLAATAIIESGLDIPRANTIIVDRADLFGLAQLYQLRGRVGRSRERAYCYLIVPPPNELSDEARARIEALERHTELGSGFQIASLDLELRGAGDLLGGEQSGVVASVGFDLFCQMLEEAVQEMRGETVEHEVDPELSFDVSALLPDDYVADVGVRLSLYKRLASALDEQAVEDVALEMEDRFGPPPEDARRLVRLMAIKAELRRWKVLGCEANARSVTFHLREDTPLDPKKVTDLVRRPKSPWRLTPDMRLSCRFDDGLDGLTHVDAALATLAKCLKDGGTSAG